MIKFSFLMVIRNLSILLILTFMANGWVYGQATTTPETAVQENQEQAFKIDGHLLELLKSKIPEDKYKEIEKDIENKELSLDQLSEVLNKVNISYDDFQTLLQEADEQLKFIAQIKAIKPVALSMHDIEAQINKTRKELEAAQSDDVEKKLKHKLVKLDQQFDDSANRLVVLISGFEERQLNELNATLAYLKVEEEEADKIATQVQRQSDFIKKIKNIETIIESMDKVRNEIAKKENESKSAQTEEEKAKISAELKKLGQRLNQLDHDYATIITGLDIDKLYPSKDDKKVSWEKELQEVFSPIIVQLKQVTERPRQIEMLNSAIGYYENRIPRIKNAVIEIGKLKNKTVNVKVHQHLEESEAFWKQQEIEFQSKLEAAKHQLFALQTSDMTFTEVMEYVLQSVLGPRIKSILFAALAFVATFLVFALLRFIILKLNPLHRFPKYMFLGNLLDVFLHFMSLGAATAAMVIVLYIYGNWLVLGLVIVIIIGLVWAIRNTLPQFVEQIKLLLGYGPVRQGERMVHNGIPYRVESIGIYCYLKNPLLTGGTVRLPMKDLIGMRSRPYDEREPWFPTKEGDWILLNGNYHCQIKLQTPQTIKLDMWEMEESLPTSSFINMRINNLSAAPYWQGFTFHVATKHRHFDYDTITQQLIDTSAEAFKNSNYADGIDYTWADFAGVSDDSTLAFTFWVLIKPSACDKFGNAKRILKRSALEIANKNNLEIVRFTHVSLQPSLSNEEGGGQT